MGHFGSTTARRTQVVKDDLNTAYGVGSAVLGNVLPVTAPFTMIIGMVRDAKAIYSTVNHIRALEIILAQASSPGSGAHNGTVEAIAHCLTKKTHKAAKRGLRLLPKIGGMFTTGYAALKNLYKRAKGTLGVHRRESASTLLVNSINGDPFALSVCVNLMGEKPFLEVYEAARTGGDSAFNEAVESLMEKFKSM